MVRSDWWRCFCWWQVIPVYYNNIKINNVFEGVAQKTSLTETTAGWRINKLFDIQSIDIEALPKSFFDNLSITKENGKFKIGSEYHITLWLFGKPQKIDPESDYKESEVEPMDKIRLTGRMDFDFAPYQETP